MTYQYAVMMHGYDTPHRDPQPTWEGEPVSEEEWCKRWVDEFYEYSPDASRDLFYVVRREVTDWERFND